VPGKPRKKFVCVTILADFLAKCLAGNQKVVYEYVSPLLQSSSQYVWQATKRRCTYHHSYGVPHNVPGRSPKGISRITTPAEFLTMCLADHQKDVYASPLLPSSSQCAWQITERKFTYHHPCRVPHSIPGRPPNGHVRITILTEFLTVRLADHLTEVYGTTYAVPHSMPGVPPKGSVLVATSGDLTEVYGTTYVVPHSVSGMPPKGSVLVATSGDVTEVYGTTYAVPHSVPGVPLKGSVMVATSGDLLTAYVAGHQTKLRSERFATGERVTTIDSWR
jgi:hypothetical protein